MWPDASNFVWGESVPAPEAWGKPGLVMFFNLECPACISRGVPFLKRLARDHGDKLVIVMVHTSFGHKRYARDETVPTLLHFAESFAAIPFPIALDLDGELAERWGVEGTPHWFAFDRAGEVMRSIYGSQENAQVRLEYLLDEVTVG
ncbi:alkyl hydroperoxide reductase [soil metagenome]